LRESAPDLEFRDLDLLHVDASGGDFMVAAKNAIQAAAEGADVVVAHGTVAALAVEAVDARTDVVLLSPMGVTKDSPLLRLLRSLFGGPAAGVLTAAARSKRKKMLDDEQVLRRQMNLLLRSDKISPVLVREARERLADPRMNAFVERTSQTLCELLTPSSALARFKGAVFFGNGPMDRKAQKHIAGTVLEGAWSAPMLEQPEAIAGCLRRMRAPEAIA
jgi:hypothetical protein